LYGKASYNSPLVASDGADFVRVDNINIGTPELADSNDWGFEVVGIEDTNNDGKDEAVIMMQGSKALFYLPDPTDPSTRVFFSSNGVLRRASGAGDFNNDGFNDMVFGDNSGVIKVYFGGQDTENGNAPILGTTGGSVTFTGISANALMASGGGDFNGDGYDDLAVLDNTANVVYVIH